MDPAPPSPTPTTTTPKKGNGLAITAVVLASLFFLPLIPFIGLVLGIVALATGRSKAISITAICLGGFFTLVMGMYFAIAVPAFMKYIRRSKTVEATMEVRRISDSLMAMQAQQWASLPATDWTPPGTACGQPQNKFAANPAPWQAEPWRSLGVSMDQAHYYQYRITRDDHGFLVEARGDLDCDGKMSYFQRQVSADGVGPLVTADEVE
jgi:disulfide bond formation protein DsbB